jgi:hypothetical protein
MTVGENRTRQRDLMLREKGRTRSLIAIHGEVLMVPSEPIQLALEQFRLSLIRLPSIR